MIALFHAKIKLSPKKIPNWSPNEFPTSQPSRMIPLYIRQSQINHNSADWTPIQNQIQQSRISNIALSSITPNLTITDISMMQNLTLTSNASHSTLYTDSNQIKIPHASQFNSLYHDTGLFSLVDNAKVTVFDTETLSPVTEFNLMEPCSRIESSRKALLGVCCSNSLRLIDLSSGNAAGMLKTKASFIKFTGEHGGYFYK